MSSTEKRTPETDRSPGRGEQIAPALPRGAEAVLRRAIRDADAREGVLGDLREEHEQVAARYPRPVPWLWCWAAAMGIARRYRRADAERSELPGRHRVAADIFRALGRDLGLAGRSLRRSPMFTLVVVLTLALGIAANTLVFTVFDGVLLAPLPYEEPDQLVRLYNIDVNRPERGMNFVLGPGFMAYRELTDVFEGLATQMTYRRIGADLTVGDEPVRVLAMPISADLFRALGVPLTLGREFDRDEEDGARRVILSHDLWQRLLGAQRSPVGHTVELDGVAYRVVGVAPAGFRNPLGWQVDLWIPANLRSRSNTWYNNYLSAVGRLQPGVTVEQANARLDSLSAGLHDTQPESAGVSARVVPLINDTVGETRPMLYVLTGAVLLVLLVSCVNVASLFLVRGIARSRDFALRTAMGARRADLVRHMLMESLLLSGAGGLLGVGLSVAGLRLIVGAGIEIPRLAEVTLDPRALAFTFAVCGVVALLFGLAPALRLSRPDLDAALRVGARGWSHGRRDRRLRDALVVAEIALAVILLVGAGLLVRSLVALSGAELGLRPDGVLTFEIHLPSSRYTEPEQRIAFFESWFDRVRALPGVAAIGAVSYLPTEGRYHRWSFGRPDVDREQQPDVDRDNRMVAGDYFEAMGIQLLRGRTFTPQDTADSQRVVILNRYLAARAFPDRDALGASILQMGREWEVVGIVEDTAYDPQGSVVGKLYYPHQQFAWNRNWALAQAVRAEGDPTALVAALRAELRSLDPRLVLYRVRTMHEVIGRGISQQRFTGALMGVFAVGALALAALGIYGILAHNVTSRTQEIGIRMALGANRTRVRRLILGKAAWLTALGVALGTGSALLLARTLSSLLFEVRPHDPGVFAGVVVALSVVAVLAAYLPALRATALDPRSALGGDGNA